MRRHSTRLLPFTSQKTFHFAEIMEKEHIWEELCTANNALLVIVQHLVAEGLSVIDIMHVTPDGNHKGQ